MDRNQLNVFNPDTFRTSSAFNFRAPGAGYLSKARTRKHGMVFGMGGLRAIEADETEWWKALPAWATQIQSVYNSQQLYELNIERAQAGLPPLSATTMGATPSINFGVNPDTQKMLLIGGGLLLAFLLLKKA